MADFKISRQWCVERAEVRRQYPKLYKKYKGSSGGEEKPSKPAVFFKAKLTGFAERLDVRVRKRGVQDNPLALELRASKAAVSIY